MLLFHLHPLYFIIVGPALLLALWAQLRTQSSFRRFSRVGNSANLSGAEAAAVMLRGQGIAVVASGRQAQQMDNAVTIQPVQGFLSDHYDPRAKVLRLSPQVFSGRSLSAVGVACHEAGHALQHARGYAPLALRTAMAPVASFGSWLAFPLIIIGAFIGALGLIKLGILLFAAIVAFQVVTLPVEFDASRRAKLALAQQGIIRSRQEEQGVASVLGAAAMTYVAAVISSLATLLYYVMIFSGARD